MGWLKSLRSCGSGSRCGRTTSPVGRGSPSPAPVRPVRCSHVLPLPPQDFRIRTPARRRCRQTARGPPAGDVSVADFHAVQHGGVEQLSGLGVGVGVGGVAARGELEREVEDVCQSPLWPTMASSRSWTARGLPAEPLLLFLERVHVDGAGLDLAGPGIPAPPSIRPSDTTWTHTGLRKEHQGQQPQVRDGRRLTRQTHARTGASGSRGYPRVRAERWGKRQFGTNTAGPERQVHPRQPGSGSVGGIAGMGRAALE